VSTGYYLCSLHVNLYQEKMGFGCIHVAIIIVVMLAIAIIIAIIRVQQLLQLLQIIAIIAIAINCVPSLLGRSCVPCLLALSV
jgi:hypothetical protein